MERKRKMLSRVLTRMLAVMLLMCCGAPGIIARGQTVGERRAQRWEVGTIAYANGQNRGDTNRLRTADYLKLEDYSAVTVNREYMLVRFVYDGDYNYIHGTRWLGSGVGFSVDELRTEYPDGVYFRVALCAADGRELTLEDLAASGVRLWLPGEEVAVPGTNFQVTDVARAEAGGWQDGAIWNGNIFVLSGKGNGIVLDVKTGEKLGDFELGGKDRIVPHANSVCFGNTYYGPEDGYPLLYVNVYNNYSASADRMEGTCCVYRITESENGFATELVQIIRIGFTEDLSLWKSRENNGDVRPYGNFVVDTDAHQLYAFVMRDAEPVTRFFSFDIPGLQEGTYSDVYGCNVVTLETEDIRTRFDTGYFSYLQGCCYSSGMILSVEGFGGEVPLRVVDLESRRVTGIYYLDTAGLTAEPEVICVDPADGKLYYIGADHAVRVIALGDTHFHSYQTSVTGPTCTEQGYTSHSCTCGKHYVTDYVDALEHDWAGDACRICGEPRPETPEEIALKQSKSDALAELDRLLAELTEKAADENRDALEKSGETARAAINSAATEDAVEALLAGAEEELSAIAGRRCAAEKFVDVSQDSWYHNALDFVLNGGMMSGYSENCFAPEDPLSRAMLIQILYNVEGRPGTSLNQCFTDVTEEDWWYCAVLWGAEKGIVLGNPDGTYDPTAPVTREQMVTILYRYAGSPETEAELSFADKDLVEEWAEKAVAWAADSGIVQGVGMNLFDPDGNTTRAEIAQVMMNCFA